MLHSFTAHVTVPPIRDGSLDAQFLVILPRMSSLVQDLAANATRKAPNPNPCLCHGRNRAADSSQQYGIARTGLVADCPLCLLVEDQLIIDQRLHYYY